MKKFIELWPVHWLIIIACIWAIKSIIGKDVAEIIKVIVSEFGNLAKLKFDHKGIDALAIFAVLFFAIVLWLSSEAGELIVISSVMGLRPMANELRESIRPEYLVLSVVLIAMFSVWTTKDS